MASVKGFKQDGSESAPKTVSDFVFGVEANVPLVHQVVVALRNAKRQGNTETKTRGEVSGGGIKPFRQKGTGRSRQGSSREPQMKGGGTVWGPHKRSYRQHVPLKMRRKALRCALSDRVRKDALCVVENLTLDRPKTTPMRALWQKLSPEGRKTLLVTAAYSANVIASSRNLARLTVRTAADVNALDVLDARRVIVEEGAIAALEERLS